MAANKYTVAMEVVLAELVRRGVRDSKLLLKIVVMVTARGVRKFPPAATWQRQDRAVRIYQ